MPMSPCRSTLSNRPSLATLRTSHRRRRRHACQPLAPAPGVGSHLSRMQGSWALRPAKIPASFTGHRGPRPLLVHRPHTIQSCACLRLRFPQRLSPAVRRCCCLAHWFRASQSRGVRRSWCTHMCWRRVPLARSVAFIRACAGGGARCVRLFWQGDRRRIAANVSPLTAPTARATAVLRSFFPLGPQMQGVREGFGHRLGRRTPGKRRRHALCCPRSGWRAWDEKRTALALPSHCRSWS